MSARLTPSEPPPKVSVPPPLRLGTVAGQESLLVRAYRERVHLQLSVIARDGSLWLTKGGAVALADWLREWARPRTKIKLVGPAELCKLHKVSHRTLAKWRTIKGFPKPLAELKQGPVWEADAVRTWVRLDRPKRGRRPNARKR